MTLPRLPNRRSPTPASNGARAAPLGSQHRPIAARCFGVATTGGCGRSTPSPLDRLRHLTSTQSTRGPLHRRPQPATCDRRTATEGSGQRIDSCPAVAVPDLASARPRSLSRRDAGRLARRPSQGGSQPDGLRRSRWPCRNLRHHRSKAVKGGVLITPPRRPGRAAPRASAECPGLRFP